MAPRKKPAWITQRRRGDGRYRSNGVQGTAAAREHKQEFQRLSYAGQKRGDRDRQRHTTHHRTTRSFGAAKYIIGGARQ